MHSRSLVVALLALSACHSPRVNTVQSSGPGSEQYEKVVFSGKLDRSVRIEEVRTDTRDGFLRAQVDLLNSGTQKETFEYAFEWFDEQGMQVAPNTSIWAQATIFPGERRSFLATAGVKAASDFRFKVKDKE